MGLSHSSAQVQALLSAEERPAKGGVEVIISRELGLGWDGLLEKRAVSRIPSDLHLLNCNHRNGPG